MRVSAKSVILEILSAHQEAVAVRHLVRAAAIFGVAENSVRVAIVRLRAEGLVESTDRGVYKLGPAARPVDAQVNAYRTIAERMSPWDGSWIAVFTADLSRTDRPALRRRSLALKLRGFREFRQGLHLRPANLVGGLDALRPSLQQLGLDERALLFTLGALSPEEDALARSLWDANALLETYRDMQNRLDRSVAQMAKMSEEETIREAFLLGREAIRLLVLDPLLPEPLVPAAERGRLASTCADYQDRGVEHWRRYLGPLVP